MERETLEQALARGLNIQKVDESYGRKIEHRPMDGIVIYTGKPRNKKSKAWFIWLWLERKSPLKEMGCRGGRWWACYQDGDAITINAADIEDDLIEMGWVRTWANRKYKPAKKSENNK